MSLKKDIMWRVGLVYLVMFGFGLTIIARVLWLQVFVSEKWKEKATTLSVHDIPPSRGNIYATDGRMLAGSVPYYEIRFDLKCESLTDDIFYKNIDSLSFRLARLFGDRPAQQYKMELIDARKKEKRYYLVKNKVDYNELQVLKTFPIFRLGRYKGGFMYNQENDRFQPHIYLAERTIGYLSKGASGNIVGLEGAYDQYLKGVQGKRLMQKISGGIWMPVNDENEVDPQDGDDLVTTIDINLQDVAHSALATQLRAHEADHGCAVVMEVHTGDIKAIVNLQRDKNGNYRELYNYAIGESSEPGSTFKLPVIMAALEDGYINLNDTIDTGNGTVKYYDKVVSDTKVGGYGKITVQEVLEHSSNVGMSKIITKYYTGKESSFIDRLYSMRLNQKLGIEILGEGAPEIKYPDSKLWSGISLAMISHGYEVRMTPLQILTFYNAVANDGTMVKPRFVKEIKVHDKVVKRVDVEVLHPSICSTPTLKKARKMLEGVVENGTATNLKNNHFKIAGKTGTAQINYADKSQKLSYQASFVGYFPAEKPKYSCIVVVNAPSSDVYYGNLVAGPVFEEIANKVYATNLTLNNEVLLATTKPVDPPYSKNGYRYDLENVLKRIGCATVDTDVNSNWVATKKTDESILMKDETIRANLVPNVVEMGAKDAIYILENMGMQVELIGRGKVIKQSILPGTRIQKGDKIILEMSFT